MKPLTFSSARSVRRICALVTLAATAWAQSPPPAAEPLTRIVDVHALPREQAAEGRPVAVRGVVTIVSSEKRDFIIEDETDGIFVQSIKDTENPAIQSVSVKNLKPGMLVEVRGVTRPGGYAPVIEARSVKLLGTAPLPAARPAALSMLLAGAMNSRRVELGGVVQRVDQPGKGGVTSLQIANHEGRFTVEIQEPEGMDIGRLLDAEVRVTGACGSVFNLRGELTGIRLRAQGAGDVVVVTPALRDPFAVPEAASHALRPFQQNPASLHRQRLSGQVTLARPGEFLFLLGKERSFRVNTRSEEVFAPGDVVEASGFVALSDNFAVMNEALIRKTGSAPRSVPMTITKDELFTPRAPLAGLLRVEDFDGRLVTLEGQLVKTEVVKGNERQLYLDCDGSIIIARLGKNVTAAALSHLQPGSEVEATGICEVSRQEGWPPKWTDWHMPESVSLLLQNAGSIRVLRAPSWWTRGRILWLASGLAVIVVVGSGWVALLRRTVRRQAGRIEQALRSHRDSELEFAAARRERNHLAADLHDGLQQLITGASYRFEAALRHLGPVPAGAGEQFAAARAAIERTRSGLRECLLGLRQVEEGPAEFAAMLRSAVTKMEHWPEGAVEIATEGEPFPLSRYVMGSLLLLMQEAVGNAFRHGAATRVRVCLHYRPESLEMCVEDNGSGFDPKQVPEATSGHFGLESMRHRLLWLGGGTEITSEVGSGTRIIARLAREKAAPKIPEPAEREEAAP